MKIYVSEKEIDDNGLNYVEDDFVEEYFLSRGVSQGKDFEFCDDVGLVEIQSLEQHDKELRKQERQKVIAELEGWAAENLTKLIKRGYFLPNNLRGLRLVEYEELKQKLNEMKGEK